MFQVLADQITKFLLSNHVIKKEERELYYFGIHQGLFIILNLTTSIMIGVVCNMLLESAVYIITYIPLRHYTGGFHAKTPMRCYLLSSFMMFFNLSALKLLPKNSFIYDIILSVAILVIMVFSPMEDTNKPLDNKEKTIYRKRVRLITLIEVTLIILLNSWRLENTVSCMTLAYGSVGLLMIVGWIKGVLGFKSQSTT